MARSKQNARKAKSKPKRSKEEWEAMKRANPALGQKKGDYKLAEKANVAFEKYYKEIGIIPDEEWQDFLSAMKKPLPTTFRITGSRSQAQELLKIIKGQYLNQLTEAYVGGVKVDPHFLPWYPDEMAWQLDFTRKEIRENDTLKSLHGFLVSETESGNISRQEAVSMLPPLLMDIQPHHKILDMCAAPGSKTAQLIEMLHSNEDIPEPEGFVVANDMDNKRCYLMTHQVKRIQSPNCMIINHDARILPNMITSKDTEGQFVKYDRVLCDVPCSGDGTMRKNPDIWSKWHANGAYNLHRIQKKVLQRGLELLAVGGRLVYSTCSLNPVEDEAVILTLIKQCDGAIELIDVSNQLQGLKYCKGTYSWKIMGKDKSWYEREDQAPEYFRKNWDNTMYPPLITEAQEAKLERCIRVLPHHQNTGAFFIAVLQKTKELPWISARSHTKKLQNAKEDIIGSVSSNTESEKATGENDGSKERLENTDGGKNIEGEPKAKKQKIENHTEKSGDIESSTTDEQPGTSSEMITEITEPPGSQESTNESPDKDKESSNQELLPGGDEVKVVMRGYKEDPFYFCSKDEPVWPKIQSFYEIPEDFNVEQLMFRNMKRVLYYVSEPIRNLVICNDERVKFINLGVKCFSNAPSPLVPDCDYRLSQEGMLAIHRKILGRRVQLTKADVITLLSQENPFIFKFSETAQADIHFLSPGSAIFNFLPSESDPEPNVKIVFCGWRGKTSVRSFVSRDERSHYLRLCGVELTDIQAQVQEVKSIREEESRTATPVGVQSGDEEELKQWTEGQEDPRGTEIDEQDSNGITESGIKQEVQNPDSGVKEGQNSDRELKQEVQNPDCEVKEEVQRSDSEVKEEVQEKPDSDIKEEV